MTCYLAMMIAKTSCITLKGEASPSIYADWVNGG